MGKNEIKDLNERVGKLQSQVQKDINSLKNAVRNSVDKTSCNAGDKDGKNERDPNILMNKFLEMEMHFAKEIAQIKSDIDKVDRKLTALQEYQNGSDMLRNSKSILIHGLNETVGSSLFGNVLDFFKAKIDQKLTMDDISNVYRIGKKKEQAKKPRPVVVEFCHKWKRNNVYYRKKSLKGTGIIITEKLTAKNLAIYHEVRKVVGNSCWSRDGVVYATAGTRRRQIRNESDITSLQVMVQADVNDTSQSSENEVRF